MLISIPISKFSRRAKARSDEETILYYTGNIASLACMITFAMNMGQYQRRKEKPGAMYTQHAERGIETRGNSRNIKSSKTHRWVVFMRSESH
jgi:hypothetical protein